MAWLKRWCDHRRAGMVSASSSNATFGAHGWPRFCGVRAACPPEETSSRLNRRLRSSVAALPCGVSDPAHLLGREVVDYKPLARLMRAHCALLQRCQKIGLYGFGLKSEPEPLNPPAKAVIPKPLQDLSQNPSPSAVIGFI